MPEKSGTVLTKQGLRLLADAQSGTVINFTKVVFGDGTIEGDLEELTALVSPKLDINIQSVETTGDGQSRIRILVTNRELTVGFFVREIGLFANNKDGQEILYAVVYNGDAADWLRPNTGPVVQEFMLDLITVVGNAQEVTATIDRHTMIATVEDVMQGHNHNGTNGTRINYNDLAGLPTSNFKNKIINGNFDVWQWGEYFELSPTTPSNLYTADRWVYYSWGTKPVGSISKITAQINGVPSNGVSINITQLAGTDLYANFEQRIENVHTLAGKRATLTVVAQGTNNQEIVVAGFQRFGTGGTPSPSVAIGIDNERITLTSEIKQYTFLLDIPNTSGKITGADKNDNLNISFVLQYPQVVTQKLGTINIFQVQLEDGEVATEFEQRPIQIEDLLCKRYYERIEMGGMAFVAYSNSYAHSHLLYAPKRAFPSVVSQSVYLYKDDSTIAGPTRFSTSTIGTTRANIYISKYILEADGISNIVLANRQSHLVNSGTAFVDAEIY